MRGFPATYGHGSFSFNSHVDATGALVPANVQNAVLIDEAIVTPGFRDLRDPYHLAQGGALGRVHKGLLLIRIRGRIEVPNLTQQATLDDREAAMRAAFDPYQCYLDSPTTDGAYAFDHSRRTADTATYPSGIIPVRYYARPVAQPETTETVTDGASRPYRLALVTADPRLYEQTEQTLVLTPGAPSGNVINRGTTPAPLKATILMSGAGNAAFTITRAGVAFILNLTGAVNLDSYVVIFETSGPYGIGKTVKKNGVDAFALKTSSPATWLNAPVGTTSFAISNNGGVTSCTLAWYSARA